jgi:hypothetical protein
MLSRFMTRNPDTLSLGEQILSAIVGATLATVVASAVASALVISLIALL